jgi:hypothetical protein
MLGVLLCLPALASPDWIKVDKAGTGFFRSKVQRSGYNYFRDENYRLLEDYWNDDVSRLGRNSSAIFGR